MTENEKAWLHYYLKEQGFEVDKMSPALLEGCYQFVDERMKYGAALGDAFEFLMYALLKKMGIVND